LIVVFVSTDLSKFNVIDPTLKAPTNTIEKNLFLLFPRIATL